MNKFGPNFGSYQQPTYYSSQKKTWESQNEYQEYQDNCAAQKMQGGSMFESGWEGKGAGGYGRGQGFDKMHEFKEEGYGRSQGFDKMQEFKEEGYGRSQGFDKMQEFKGEGGGRTAGYERGQSFDKKQEFTEEGYGRSQSFDKKQEFKEEGYGRSQRFDKKQEFKGVEGGSTFQNGCEGRAAAGYGYGGGRGRGFEKKGFKGVDGYMGQYETSSFNRPSYPGPGSYEAFSYEWRNGDCYRRPRADYSYRWRRRGYGPNFEWELEGPDGPNFEWEVKGL